MMNWWILVFETVVEMENQDLVGVALLLALMKCQDSHVPNSSAKPVTRKVFCHWVTIIESYRI